MGLIIVAILTGHAATLVDQLGICERGWIIAREIMVMVKELGGRRNV